MKEDKVGYVPGPDFNEGITISNYPRERKSHFNFLSDHRMHVENMFCSVAHGGHFKTIFDQNDRIKVEVRNKE